MVDGDEASHLMAVVEEAVRGGKKHHLGVKQREGEL